MARSSTGKSVARAAATGGGTTYRGQVPVNWYAALVIIVILGVASVAFARYNYAKGGPEPTVNQTWHGGLAMVICGKTEPVLPVTTASSTNGLVAAPGGVIVVAPKTNSQAGANATLGKFASEYPGMTLTDSTVRYPAATSPTYKAGEKCAAGTPDAGKAGVLRVRSWVLTTATTKNGSFVQVGGAYAPSTSGLKLLDRQLITIGFGPASETLPKPGASTVTALVQAIEGTAPPTTTTTAAPTVTPSTAAPTSSTVPVGSTTTTTAPSTTTTKPSTTTTSEVMKAVVLVGGEGTRLRPLTLSAPKQMLPIVGVPMIERVLAHLVSHGVDAAILSMGYLPNAFLEAYPEGVAAGVRLTYAVEPEPLDTAGAVRFAATFGRVDDTFVVVNGDVLTDLDLTGLLAFHRERRAEGTIALHPVPDPSAFGVVPTDPDGRVTAFVEKPPRDEAPTNQINAGTYVLEPSVLERIPTGGRVSIERETFPAMVRDGSLFARSDDGYWLDTGTPAAYLQAHHDLVSGRRGHKLDANLRDRGDGVYLEGESTIDGEVIGPSVIFGGSTVAAGARVERSVVGAGSVIASGAEVVDSVLMDGGHVAANAKVAGSVMGPHATVGQRGDVRPISVLGARAVVASGTVVDGERVSA